MFLNFEKNRFLISNNRSLIKNIVSSISNVRRKAKSRILEIGGYKIYIYI